ncbi:MAG TPA: hypothetical protein VMT54_09515 [Candidatus Cybelea sp.]|nr:hypothetical protein [Candidatus Cybelea sp.]
MYLYAFTTILTVLTIASWRKQSAQCFERECIYRRQHGKWRWER